MKYNKLLLISTSFLVMQAVSGCDTNKMESMFAPTRTVPEDSSATFGNRHVPALNPGATPDQVKLAPKENGYSDPYMASPTAMKTPVEPVMANNMSEPVPVPPVAAAVPAPTPAPAVSTPAPAVVTVAPAPISAPVPKTVVAQTNSYPSLASVPQAPSVPSKENIKNNFNSLTTAQKSSESERQSLMEDQNATVMTSPQSGRLMDNAANASPAVRPVDAAPGMASQPVTASAKTSSDTSDKGFTSWLHDTFHADDKKPANIGSNTVVRRAPVENVENMNNVAPATAYQPAPVNAPAVTTHTIENAPDSVASISTPAPVTQSEPVTAPLFADTKPQPVAPAPAVASYRPAAPATVSQPDSAPANSQNLPDIAQYSNVSEKPINLVQPTGNDSYGYIPDSRYSSRN